MAPIIGNVVAEQIRFVENGEGVYAATVSVPPYAYLLDIQVYAEALWTAATSAAMIVGDTADPNGFFDAVNLKATDLTLAQAIGFDRPGGKAGAYLTADGSAGNQNTALMSASTRNLTAEITSVGAGTAGRTVMTVVYVLPYRREVTL